MEMRSLAADLRLQFQPVTLDVGLISFVCLQETKARGQVYIWRAAGGLLTCNFRGKKTIRLLCGLLFFFPPRTPRHYSLEWTAIENLTSVSLDNAQINNKVERLREKKFVRARRAQLFLVCSAPEEAKQRATYGMIHKLLELLHTSMLERAQLKHLESGGSESVSKQSYENLTPEKKTQNARNAFIVHTKIQKKEKANISNYLSRQNETHSGSLLMTFPDEAPCFVEVISTSVFLNNFFLIMNQMYSTALTNIKTLMSSK